ncbi:hypothetical protein H1R20_g9081, partial [Candolleomyces eurysporus]
MTDLFTLLGIKHNRSTAFHPQTDGQTERINQELEQYLRIFISKRQDDWTAWLPLAVFSYNDKVHSATGYSPFFLNHGQHPWKGTEARVHVKSEPATDFVSRMKQIHEDAQSSLKAAADTMKRLYDRKRRDSVKYKPGDKVYLEATNISTTRPSRKLSDKRYGPFIILEKVGESAYKLKLPEQWKAIHPVFNEALLTPWKRPTFTSQQRPAPPPPVIVDNEREYEVEGIQDSRLFCGKLQYYVKWKGYPQEERTWEPEANVKNSPELVTAFHRKHPSAPRRINQRLRFMPYENMTEPKKAIFDWTAGKLREVRKWRERDKGIEVVEDDESKRGG